VAHGLLLSVLSAFCYGMSPILYKLGYASGLGEMDLLQYRFIVATLLIFLLLLVTSPSSLRPTTSLLLKAAFTGLVLYCLQSYLFLKALRYIPAATTSLILYFYPVTVTLLSIFFFRSRLNKVTCIALLLCLAGCVLVSLDAIHREHDITGLLLALGAMAVFSVYMITVQFVVRTDRPLTFTFYVFLFVALAFGSLHDPLALRAFDARQMLICLLLGIVPTALAVPLLYFAVQKIGSAMASLFSTFEPVATVVAAALILQERITLPQLSGMLLIIGGIVLPNLHLTTLHRRTAGQPPPGAATHDPGRID
jgi:drug/metabolite transporter (DMT)-like permease